MKKLKCASFFAGVGGIDLGFEKEFNYDDVISKLEGIDVVLFAGGISACYEGEEMPVEVDGFKGGDRTSIEFPVIQRTLIKKLKEKRKKVNIFLC